MNKRERSWVLYDVANSAFIMLATAVIPIYVSSFNMDSVVVWWGFTETIASLVVALLMPYLGSLADFHHNKKKFLIGSIATGVVACLALTIPNQSASWQAYLFLGIYIVASIGVNASVVFSDAFLPDATEEKNYDMLSSKGFAWGYIGSLIPFLTCIAVIFVGPTFGLPVLVATRISFVITAIWWLAFSIPIIRNVHQVHYKPKQDHALSKTFKGLGATIKKIIGNRAMLLFIIAYFCYMDGVHTIIKMATSYGTDLGINSTMLVLALVLTQLVAFPSALAFGKFSARVGARFMIKISVIAYALITLFAAFFLRSAVEFWILAVAVGLFQGGIQALSRSYFGKLIPNKENANEYYGFFSFLGRYAAVLGTFMMSSLTLLTGSSSLGILSITALFILGFVFLQLMPKETRYL
jgi:UMF1 family MFS transporter